MLDVSDLRFFATVASAASLAAASRMLDVTPPAVSQRLIALEKKLGIRLIERRRGTITLTDEGQAVMARGESILLELDSLQTDLLAVKGEVKGILRIGAPHGFGRRFIADAVGLFRARFEHIDVELALGDSPLDADTIDDVTIHIGKRPNSGGSMVYLAPNERILCAAPTYIERYGQPEQPDDLLKHECIAVRENNEDTTLWRFGSGARSHAIRIRPRLSCNDGEVSAAWARAALGIIMRSEWAVADDIKAGRLVRILPSHSLGSADVIAIVRPRSARLARTQSFLDLLKEQLKPIPWR
jgi:DNA-binding transcriptional LysR family regulator